MRAALIRPVAVGAALLAAAAFLTTRSQPASRPVAGAPRYVAEDPSLPAADSSRPLPDLRVRLDAWQAEDVALLEEELVARLREHEPFADAVFREFLAETDPMKASFLQNVLADDPHRRNDSVWQERFMTVVETDARAERRRTALLFLQQAESIGAVRARLCALAQAGELREHALIALHGLPGRRPSDPCVRELAGRIAQGDPDPELRGLAIRVEGNPERAARMLADRDAGVRAQAALVATSRDALAGALEEETDGEVRGLIERRLAELH